MRQRTKGLLVFIVLIVIIFGGRLIAGVLLEEVPHILTSEEKALRTKALELHQYAIVIDGHNDVATRIIDWGFDLGMDGDEPNDRDSFLYEGGPFTWLPNPPFGDNVRTDLDIARAREGGLDAQFFSIWVDSKYYDPAIPGQSIQRALGMIDALQKQVSKYPEDLEKAISAQDVYRISSAGKLAVLMGLEGGHAIEDNIENLRRFYELGIRYMTLTHNSSNSWADSSTGDTINNGLSNFGREVVREMNRLGMIIDVSHVSDDTFWDVLEVTSTPVIASHSNCRSIANHPRNLSDEMLRAIASNGGVIMIDFMNIHLDPGKTAEWKLYSGWHWFTHPGNTQTPLSLLIDHIDHAVKVAGIDHVGLGSDFDGAPLNPQGLQDVSDLPNITFELMRRGYSDEEIRKILGGNILRVMEEVEQVAAHLSTGKE